MVGQRARWWWLRHAQVYSKTIYGQMDLPCDISDHQTFKDLVRRLPANLILCESPLSRVRQTTVALISQGLILPPPLIVPEFQEQHFGDWQGRSWSDIKDDHFWIDPVCHHPPKGESFLELCQRVHLQIKRLDTLHKGQNILAVAHAGPIRAAIALAQNLSFDAALALDCPPLSLIVIS